MRRRRWDKKRFGRSDGAAHANRAVIEERSKPCDFVMAVYGIPVSNSAERQ